MRIRIPPPLARAGRLRASTCDGNVFPGAHNRALPLFVATVSALAGCLGAAPGPVGCDFGPVQAAHGGDRFEFDASGLFFGPSFSSPVDWRQVNPNSTIGQDAMAFPAGSRLVIALSAEPQPRLDMLGRLRPSFQATYWAEDPREPRPIPFLDEWLDQDTSALVQLSHRVNAMESGRTWHSIHHARIFQPALFGAMLLWGKSLSPGEEGEYSWPSDQAIPTENPDPSQSMRYTVTDVRPRDGPGGLQCTAELHFLLRLTPTRTLREYSGTAILTENVPVPLEYSLEIPGEAGARWGSPFHLSLQRMTAGSGSQLPAPSPDRIREAFPSLGLATAPPSNGFLPETDPLLFPTAFVEARGAAENDSRVRGWRDAHLASALFQATHRGGRTGSPVLDGWDLRWSDSAGVDGLSAAVTKTGAPGGLGLAAKTVDVSPGPAQVPANATDRMVTFDELARVQTLTYGESLSYLDCGLPRDWCQFGPHEALGEPYAADGGAGLAHTGLLVWISRGWVLQESSLEDAVLGLPVAVDSGP